MGYLCGTLKILPGHLKVLMEAKNVKFSHIIDGVGYLNVVDAITVAEECVRVVEEISSAVTSHERN
jgi:hypothetical protein